MKNIEINAWLDGPMDYEQGRVLFEKYSGKKPLINLFRRKHKPDVLRYNLEKLCSKIPDKKPEIRKEKKPDQKRKLIIVDDRIRLEDLPDHLKPLYEQNRELYKQMRALHEKMKLAASDEKRAEFRKQLEEYDDEVARNWDILDSWDGTMEEPSNDTQNLHPDEKEKLVNAHRKFISVNLKKLKSLDGLQRQQMIYKISERVQKLSKTGEAISKEMNKELKSLGINF